MIAVGFEKYGSQRELEKDAIKHLYDIYIKVNAEAKKECDCTVRKKAQRWSKRREDADEADVEAEKECKCVIRKEAQRWFKRMEDGDEEALKNWRVWREMSVKKYAEEYNRLNVQFDVYTGESMVGKEWQDKALERLDEMGLISDAHGAKVVDLEKWKLQTAMLRKKGTNLLIVVFLL